MSAGLPWDANRDRGVSVPQQPEPFSSSDGPHSCPLREIDINHIDRHNDYDSGKTNFPEETQNITQLRVPASLVVQFFVRLEIRLLPSSYKDWLQIAAVLCFVSSKTEDTEGETYYFCSPRMVRPYCVLCPSTSVYRLVANADWTRLDRVCGGMIFPSNRDVGDNPSYYRNPPPKYYFHYRSLRSSRIYWSWFVCLGARELVTNEGGKTDLSACSELVWHTRLYTLDHRLEHRLALQARTFYGSISAS